MQSLLLVALLSIYHLYSPINIFCTLQNYLLTSHPPYINITKKNFKKKLKLFLYQFCFCFFIILSLDNLSIDHLYIIYQNQIILYYHTSENILLLNYALCIAEFLCHLGLDELIILSNLLP